MEAAPAYVHPSLLNKHCYMANTDTVRDPKPVPALLLPPDQNQYSVDSPTASPLRFTAAAPQHTSLLLLLLHPEPFPPPQNGTRRHGGITILTLVLPLKMELLHAIVTALTWGASRPRTLDPPLRSSFHLVLRWTACTISQSGLLSCSGRWEGA